MTVHPAAIVADAASLVAIVAGATHALPEIATGLGAVLACIWYAILIVDRFRGKQRHGPEE